ncbi:Branched-chain amino acid transport protein (AzlD) [Corynebacterium capitovis DSM 44611]|uniref:AzlD domain-containing protein n=1 Tax=Corynebacterium capitovis TaxID=131081 RepID=UPI000362C284|nr:AzlD domain-containing protein [Corynebacterium capitovis]WKD58422.1 Branched-chain amino acid transport protein (AzlD) [Corynebacterium capitovis DSM 44611]
MGLPAGVGLGAVLAVLLPVGAVTLLLRALPFSFLRLLKGSPLIEFLGAAMPVGVMVVLVVYVVAGASGTTGGVPVALMCALATLALHAWRRSTVLSIVGGTALYMALVNLVL